MIVMKFGGTSVGSAELVRAVAGIVQQAREAEPVAVVVSAHGGVTDLLLELAETARQGRVDLSPLLEREHAVLDGLGLPRDLERNPDKVAGPVWKAFRVAGSRDRGRAR